MRRKEKRREKASFLRKLSGAKDMKRLKPLLPSLKQKNRYLVYEVISEKSTNKEITKKLDNHLKEFLGTFNYSCARIKFIATKKNKGIIMVSSNYVDLLKSALLFFCNSEDIDVIVRSIGVSGILKKAKDKYFN